MRILVTGATGFIGQNVVKALANAGHELVLTSREGARVQSALDQHDWRQIDFATAHHPDDWRDIVDKVDIVINAVGIFSQTKAQRFEALHDKAPRALFKACEKAGVQRIIQISALGADDRATSAYHLSKKRADDALVGGSVNWIILRPSLIIGGDGKSWLFFKALAMLPLTPVIGDGNQPLQPVTILDVVKGVLSAINAKDAIGHRINLVGEECLTLRAYLQALSSWMSRTKFRAIHIPYALAGNLAAAGWLFDNIPLNRDAVSMLRQARVYEGGDCQAKLGFTPRGIGTFLAQNLPLRSECVAARQTFLRPLLRLGLAFMWIMAGVVSIFFYPREDSLALLSQMGLNDWMGTVALYGAALLDVTLGLVLLTRTWISRITTVQIFVILFYTLALSWVVPALWTDPFGALVKNIPIIFSILILASLEKE